MCIVRIIETRKGDVLSSGRWVYAQLNVGIACACLPTLGPLVPESVTLVTSLRGLLATFRTAFRSSSSGRTQGSGDAISDSMGTNGRKRYRNISEDGMDMAHLTEITRGNEPLEPIKNFPNDRITVQQDIDVV